MGIRIMMSCSSDDCRGKLVFTPGARRSSTDAPMATCPECGTTFGLFAGDVIPLLAGDVIPLLAGDASSMHARRPA